MKFFKKLLGVFSHDTGNRRDNFGSAINVELEEAYDPNNEHDRVGLALLVILRKQVELLDLSLGRVPIEEPFSSFKCRGALAGTAIGVLEAESLPLTKDRLIDTNIAAFGLVFGDPEGRELAMQTASDMLEQNPGVMAASEWAREDVIGYYANGGDTTAMGFYVAAQGMI